MLRSLILFIICEGSAARASKLRYPLRSASKGKAAVVSPAADAPPTISAPRRCVFTLLPSFVFFFPFHILRWVQSYFTRGSAIVVFCSNLII
jgi:hypothetical protein